MKPDMPYLDIERGVGLMGSEDSLRKILETVDISLTASIPDIWQALETGDVKAANRLLHGIKGYVPIFCSDALVEQVTQVELQSKTAAAAFSKPLFDELVPKLEDLLLEIRTYIE